MSRDAIVNAVISRDGACVMCGNKENLVAHHIIERKLWNDETNWGYIPENLATVCPQCHIIAEMTLYSCEELRENAGITTIILPPHLDEDETFDKWGNIILHDGRRLRGELFFDDSVQKILAQADLLGCFVQYIKYPRTPHLPMSPGATSDDKVLDSTDHFIGKEVVATLKMDGACTTLYADYMHARSIDSESHPSQAWVRNFWSQIKHDIPEGWRFCVEDVYAKHSIHYNNLKSYAYLFCVWNERSIAISYDEMVEWAELLGIEMCPLLYRGIWDEKAIQSLAQPRYDGDEMEGFVVRVVDSFPAKDFKTSVAKWVREGHVTSDAHWRYKRIVKNELRNEECGRE